MPKMPDFKPFQRGDRWIVSVPPSMTATGKRKRKVLKTETEALKYAAKMRASYATGIRGSALPHTVALQATEAMRILEGTGISIVEAARMAASKLASAGAVEEFGDRYDRAVRANKGVWSSRYRADMARVPRWVAEWFMVMPCGTIDRETIERALMEGKALSRSTLDTRARYVAAVLGFRERHRKSSEIVILSPGECEAMIEACQTDEERWAVALLLFAGIRPDGDSGELSRLDWASVGRAEIYVSREVSKVGDRHIKILPRLKRMIAGHPKAGRVRPNNWQRRWPEIRKEVGITVQDVTRHTFASNHLAAYGMVATQAAMGHVPMSPTTRAHYVKSITKAQAVKYFA